MDVHGHLVLYSTEQCQRGYVCDPSDGTCVLGAPGTGTTLAKCEAACKHHKPNVTQVYKCDPATKTCHAVPPGTSGSTSKTLCEDACQHKPTPKPGPAAKTYLCNYTTLSCDVAQPGHGASKLLCEKVCNKDTKFYLCNTSRMQCQAVTPGTPGSGTLAQCQEVCGRVTPMPTVPPSPAPPPEYIGTWRGVEIQSGYKVREWDVQINHTWATFESNTFASGGAPTKVTFAGVPYHIPNSPKLEMWIELKQGPGAGKTLRTIGDVSGARGPETEFATMAMAPLGDAAPSSIDTAMLGNGFHVLALSRCIVGNPLCTFVLAAPRPPTTEAAVNKVLPPPRPLGGGSDTVQTVGDECSKYSETCSVCVAHPACGWCSTPVVYRGGVKGTQCAGFEGNHTPFVCPGRYSTGHCEVGYACQSGSFKCEPTLPGNGMPEAVCEATCKPTPPPAPRVPQYTCDLATHTCKHCTSEHCPGSMPQGQCDQLCTHPHHGPTPMIAGVWRGIYIQERYSVGEVDLYMNGTGCTVYKDGAEYFYADVISLGADVMLFTVTHGAHAGSKFGAIYQLATQDFGLYSQMTMAFGKAGGSFPTDYNEAMFTPGMQEIVVAKCEKEPCVFRTP